MNKLYSDSFSDFLNRQQKINENFTEYYGDLVYKLLPVRELIGRNSMAYYVTVVICLSVFFQIIIINENKK